MPMDFIVLRHMLLEIFNKIRGIQINFERTKEKKKKRKKSERNKESGDEKEDGFDLKALHKWRLRCPWHQIRIDIDIGTLIHKIFLGASMLNICRQIKPI